MSLLVSAAAAAVSVAGILANVFAMTTIIVLALMLLVAFVAKERGASTRVLSALTYQVGSTLKCVYLTIAAHGGERPSSPRRRSGGVKLEAA